MSKKSRRRNKKILAMLALAGGAAMMGRGKGMSGKETVSDAQKAHNFALTDSAPVIRKDVVANAAANAAANTGSNFQTKYSKKIGDRWMTPNQIRLGNINPHEATAAAGAAYTSPRVRTGLGPRRFVAKGGSAYKKGGRIRKQFGGALPVGGTARRDMRSGYYPSDMGMRGGPMYKKGGRVTGIAKRGFGRALMKGKK